MTSIFASCMNYTANQALFDIAFDDDVLQMLVHPADRSHIEKLVSDVGMSFIHNKGLMISRMRVVCVSFFFSFHYLTCLSHRFLSMSYRKPVHGDDSHVTVRAYVGHDHWIGTFHIPSVDEWVSRYP